MFNWHICNAILLCLNKHLILTDISGGFSLSLLDALRLAVLMSKNLSVGRSEEEYKFVDWKEAFRLATLGGAQGG